MNRREDSRDQNCKREELLWIKSEERINHQLPSIIITPSKLLCRFGTHFLILVCFALIQQGTNNIIISLNSIHGRPNNLGRKDLLLKCITS